MRFGCGLALYLAVVAAVAASQAQTDTSSSSSRQVNRKPASAAGSSLDAGTLSNGIYHNRELGFSCKIPPGWVTRTDEMNAREEDSPTGESDPPKESSVPARADEKSRAKSAGRVLLAAFSRPPQATGQDVNSSILIAAESVAAYPGLKEAVQYFGPLTEVARAQGFTGDGEPYEIAVGTKALAREDFHKDVGSRVMHQSTLVMLGHGYALSFTFIGGTEEEVEELMDGLSFASTRTAGK
jgi:hypothetical protein